MRRKAVKELYCDTVNEKAESYDFSEGYPETWDVPFMIPEDDDEHCQDDYLPMMNYRYGLSDEFDRDHETEDLRKVVDDMKACTIVYFDHEGTYYLALTCGGMDLSWQICHDYMLLGYLPPVHFCDLPDMATPLTAWRRWVLAGCRRSLRLQGDQGKRMLKRLSATAKSMTAREKGK